MKQSSITLHPSNSFVLHFEIHNNLLCAHSHMKYRDRAETKKTKSLIVYVCKKSKELINVTIPITQNSAVLQSYPVHYNCACNRQRSERVSVETV